MQPGFRENAIIKTRTAEIVPAQKRAPNYNAKVVILPNVRSHTWQA